MQRLLFVRSLACYQPIMTTIQLQFYDQSDERESGARQCAATIMLMDIFCHGIMALCTIMHHIVCFCFTCELFPVS